MPKLIPVDYDDGNDGDVGGDDADDDLVDGDVPMV